MSGRHNDRMWLFTKIGFFSVVEDPQNSDVLIIRARAWKDLVALEKSIRKKKLVGTTRMLEKKFREMKLGQPIESGPDRDYPYRMRVWRMTLSEWMKLHIEDELNYFNFKAEVGKTNPARERVYHSVWSALLDLQMRAP